MNKTIVICAAIAALIVLKTARGSFGDPEDQTGSIIDQVPDFEDMANYAQDAFEEIDMEQGQKNLAALLLTVRKAEGTAGPNGYRTLFGGGLFSDLSQHPRQFFTYKDKAGNTIRTSAAGAYQITATTYDALMRKYPGQFSGFTEADQDAMAAKLIEERGALSDVYAGRLARAIEKIRPIWASLPGAGANQPERSMDFIQTAYINAGGALA